MKNIKASVALLVLIFALCGAYTAKAQCSVCSIQVTSNKSNGGTQANGLNKGIMYLLAAPYIAVAAIGYIWYRKYRRKNVTLNMRNEKLNLN